MAQIFITPLSSTTPTDTFFASNAHAVKIKITNADRIRNMGDIELANFLSGLTMCGCVNCPMYYPEENDECIKRCNSVWQEWVRKESEDK